MPRGDKSKYTDKQERMADHIAEGYESRGVSEKEAERRAWATVNKETGGGKKSGSCPMAWCRSAGSLRVSGGSGRFCQAATAGSLTKGSSLNGALVSSVM
jgi:plasmid stabilization system protein ParE